jgi:hypothetical protein
VAEQRTTLTTEQLRVLKFCARSPGWISLLELETIKLLEPDDVVTVPSLVERNLLRHEAVIQAVAITPAGQVLADEH